MSIEIAKAATRRNPPAQQHCPDVIQNDVGLAVANRVFGKDTLKPISACPPKPWRRRKELNGVLVA